MAAELPVQNFAVACVCGEIRQGRRQHGFQVLACARCKAKIFVLPASPWPESEEELARLSSLWLAKASAGPRAAKSETPSPWRQTIIAGSAALLLAVGVSIILVAYLWPDRSIGQKELIAGEVAAARAAIKRHDLNQALEALSRARLAYTGAGKLLPPPEAQQVLTLERQTKLLANLLEPSLEELLIECRDMPAELWDARFREKYLDRSVVFHARVVRRSGFEVDYALEANGTPGKVSLDDLRDTHRFGIEDPTRWLLGARLASLRHEANAERPPGVWVVRFEMDSLVLIDQPELIDYLGLGTDPEPVEPRPERGLPRPGDSADSVRQQLGAPDWVSRQALAGRIIEQWSYDRQPALHINLERHPEQAPHVARLGPALPR